VPKPHRIPEALDHFLPIAVFEDSTSSLRQLGLIVNPNPQDNNRCDALLGAPEPPRFRINVGFRRVGFSGEATFFRVGGDRSETGNFGGSSILPVRLRVRGGASVPW
jgi:hypothetical protein